MNLLVHPSSLFRQTFSKMLKTIVFLCLATFAVGALVGGYVDAEVDRDDVLAAANHAAKGLSKQFSSSYHHRLFKVLKAQTQVVAGINYRLDVIVGQTTCKKSEVEYEQTEDCEFTDWISTYKKCQVVVYQNLKGENKLVSSGCILTSKKDL